MWCHLRLYVFKKNSSIKVSSLLSIFYFLFRSDFGVFAKKLIPKACRFGPLEGRPAAPFEMSGDGVQKFQLLVRADDGTISRIDVSDEDNSNWMRFVRPATSFAEQNTIITQVTFIRRRIFTELNFIKQFYSLTLICKSQSLNWFKFEEYKSIWVQVEVNVKRAIF